jgi:hypothetical protein
VKTKLAAKDFLAAIKTVSAVQGFGQNDEEIQPGMLTVSDGTLEIVSARLGAYVVKRCDATLLRAGSVGVNLKQMEGMKLAGTVTIDASADQIKITDGKTKVGFPLHGTAAADIMDQRGAVTKIQALAKVPAMVFRAGAEFGTYKSEIKDGYTIQITIRNGYFEFAGLDHLACGRYCTKNEDVKAKADFHFTLGDTLLSKILSEVSGDTITVGLSKDGSIVRLTTADFECYHPTVDKEYMDTDQMVHDVTADKKKCDCQFQIDQAEAKAAIENVKPGGAKSKDARAKMEIVANANAGARLRQYTQTSSAICKLDVEGLKARGTATIIVRASYFSEFIKVAPKSRPLTVESWNKEILRIRVVVDENTKIEYMALMIGDQSAD